MASGGKGSSPYVGVQKSMSGGYVVETRHFLYQGAKYDKFYHRIKDEREAAFISDFVNYVSVNNDSTFNFENGRKVLEEHGPRLLLELEESLARCKWPALNPMRRKEKLRKCFIHDAKKLWNEHKGEILKDHIRPSQEGSKNDVVEQLNHGHEDSVQKQDHIRSLHNGSSNITLEQLNHGCENRLAGECSMTKQTEEHVSNMTKQTEEHVSNMTKHIEEHVSNTDHQVSNHIYFAVGGEATGVAMGLLMVGLEVQRQAR